MMKILILCLLISSVLCKLDADSVTVSGLSSGAYMATQIQFAHSSIVKGAAIFAGGPYWCAQNSLTTALSKCMNNFQAVSVAPLVAHAKQEAAAGNIDPIENMASQPVYIFSGTMDFTVNPKVVQSLETMYKQLGVTNILSKYDLLAAHTFPADYGNSCTVSSIPYISKCSYKGASPALSHLYGTLAPPKPSSTAHILEFNQADFVPTGSSLNSISMNTKGYAYIPAACKNNIHNSNKNLNHTLADCRLHVSFHGCKQTTNDVGMAYVEKTGLNELAESNNIIVLYPQAKATTGSNPNGCWDWWGYTNANFANKKGLQIQTVYEMIQHFLKTY